jgi:hypothetical protein
MSTAAIIVIAAVGLIVLWFVKLDFDAPKTVT